MILNRKIALFADEEGTPGTPETPEGEETEEIE